MQIRKDLILFIGVLALIGILTLIGIDIPCIFHKITGLYCPGCGVTRMFLSLARLDIISAFKYNALCFIYLILFGLYIIVLFFKRDFKVSKYVIYGMIVIALIFGVLRNIPMFSYLAP